VRTKRNWFSNFVPYDEPLDVPLDNGVILCYKTNEHWYQANKVKYILDRMKVLEEPNPARLKKVVKKYEQVADWFDRSKAVMWTGLCWKFREDTSHGQKLMDTQGDIVEWNWWHDNFWGHCCCNKCLDKEHENNLGKMLEDIRFNLRQDTMLRKE
jgi:ribA/ribD-fused uncharacterized protein